MYNILWYSTKSVRLAPLRQAWKTYNHNLFAFRSLQWRQCRRVEKRWWWKKCMWISIAAWRIKNGLLTQRGKEEGFVIQCSCVRGGLIKWLFQAAIVVSLLLLVHCGEPIPDITPVKHTARGKGGLQIDVCILWDVLCLFLCGRYFRIMIYIPPKSIATGSENGLDNKEGKLFELLHEYHECRFTIFADVTPAWVN